MKVLFLDIDEVLVTTRQWFVYRSVFCGSKYVGNKVDQTSLDFLRLLRFHGVEIVLSSTWRKCSEEKFERLKKEFKIDFKDRTPVFGSKRGEEIKLWLSEHKEVTDYVIIDDGSDMLEEQANHFVRINAETGITVRDMEKICLILGFEKPWDLRHKWMEAISNGEVPNPWNREEDDTKDLDNPTPTVQFV